MTEANDEITKLIATYIPDAAISVPTALVTADGGKTYTFGVDADANAYFPLGWFNVYAERVNIPDYPLEPGIDFEVEGTRLRFPYNTGRTFADGGPWAQTINATSVAITSSTQPTIPQICRLAMVEYMAAMGAERLGLDRSAFDDEFNKRWVTVLSAVRTQAMQKYAAPLGRRSAWNGRRW